MLSRPHVTLDAMVDTLKAAAESSRLRILALLTRGDLTVSDLTEILNQSQPRVSRHLKLLLEAGLIGRYQEGSWAFFRLSDNDAAREFVNALVSRVHDGDPQIERDLERLGAVKRKRQERAASYFSANAASWDQIRALHATDGSVEAAIRRIVGKRPFQAMLDLGTGTGRLLELLAPLYRRGVGIDMSREMLTVARANLDRAGVAQCAGAARRHLRAAGRARCVRPGHHPPGAALSRRSADGDPRGGAHAEAGGRLLIVDFASHGLEFLRDEHAHVRLGFSDGHIAEWLAEAGLDLEETQQFEPRAGADPALTVKLWLGRDRRLLIADPAPPANAAKETV